MIVSFFNGVRGVTGATFKFNIPDLVLLLGESAALEMNPARKLGSLMLSVTSYPEELKRAKANAKSAQLLAMDCDEGWTIEGAEEAVRSLRCPFVIHSTTNCTLQQHRFRILIFLDREVGAEDYERLWLELDRQWQGTMDTRTRDISRLSAMPARWQGAYNDFRWSFEGNPLSVDEMLAKLPPIEPPPAPARPVREEREKYQGAGLDAVAKHRIELRRMRIEALSSAELTDLDTSPIVPQHALADAMSSLPGGRTFSLLCSVAMSAQWHGYDIDPYDLAEIGRQFSHRVGRRTSTSELRRDATRALEWAWGRV
jgi:hypothetical protein